MAEPTLAPTSLASAIGESASAPIPVVTNPAAAPTMPVVPEAHRMPERSTGERDQPQEVLGKNSPPAVRTAQSKKGFEKHAIRSAQEMLGLRESPKKELDKMAKALREDNKTPHDVELKEAPAKAPKPAKPKDEPPEHPEPSPIAKAPEPAPEAKVKIGDKEMTPKEIADRFKELEEKANKPAAPVEKKPDPNAPENKPEEIEAEKAASRKNYIESEAKNFKPEDYGLTIDEGTFDTILAGGKEGVSAFLDTLAKVAVGAELRVMSRLEKELNPILAEYHQQLGPVSEREQQIRAYERESKFLEANQDLKPFVERVRGKAQEINNTAAFCEKSIQAGIATPEQVAYAETVRGYTPEEFDAEVARQVRVLRDQFQTSPTTNNPANQPAPSPAPKAPAPRPKPPTGQLPSTGAPTVKTGDSTLNGILASGRF